MFAVIATILHTLTSLLAAVIRNQQRKGATRTIYMRLTPNRPKEVKLILFLREFLDFYVHRHIHEIIGSTISTYTSECIGRALHHEGQPSSLLFPPLIVSQTPTNVAHSIKSTRNWIPVSSKWIFTQAHNDPCLIFDTFHLKTFYFFIRFFFADDYNNSGRIDLGVVPTHITS